MLAGRTYTLEDVARHDGRGGSSWIVIDGEVYDISTFVDRHPGGSILQLAAGRDATVLFESYHPGASLGRARRVLRRQCEHLGSLVPAEVEPYGDPTFFETVNARTQELLERRGLHVHSGARWALLESGIVVVLSVAAWYFRTFWGSYLAAVVAGVLMARMGFLMHSGNHAALGRRTIGNLLQARLMEFIGGSSFIWQYAHQVAHHGRPNVYGVDNDSEIGAPILRFHPEIARRPWHRIQPLVLGVLMSFGMVKWIITDVINLTKGRITHARFHLSRAGWYKAMGYKGLWFVAHVVVPVMTLGWLHGLLTTFVLLAVGAYYMETVFIVNHLQDDLVPPRGLHWAHQQVLGTANWSSGSRFANFISGGLNHQIEHHLFPSMSVHLYPIIAPVVQRTCEEFGLPYRDYSGFWVALGHTVGYLHDLGRPEPPVAEPIEPAQAA